MMKLKEISFEELEEFVLSSDEATFHQTKGWAKLKEYNGWCHYVVGLFDDDEIKATALLLAKEVPFIKRWMFYSPRGFIINYHDINLLKEFTKQIKVFVKSKGGIFVKIDPYVMYKERDINGDLVENGIDNSDVVNNLKSLGYKHFGFNLMQDSLQPRWMHTITVKDKSIDDVMKDMEILKEKNILKYPYTFPLNANEATTTSFIWLTYLRDGKVFNDDGTLNRENALTTLNFINDMLKKGLINPANLTLNGLDTYRQILSKDAAFMVGPTSFIARSVDPDQSKAIGEIEVILPPGKDGKATQTMALTEAVGVSSLSENKEAAKEFVKWYTSKETQKAFFKEISAIPTRTSVLNEVIDAGEIKNSGAMKETSILVKSPFPNGVPAYYAEMSNSIYNAINSMASGNLTPEEAVNQIDSKIQELIKD